MALKFERRHLTYRTWYHKRHWGGIAGAAPPPDDCCILLENDTDGTQVILLEDGSGCIEPEDCPAGDAGFLFLSDPADNFEFLEGVNNDFLFLE